MALNVRDYANAPLGLLTFFEGHIFQAVFGETIGNLRILCQLNIFLATVLCVGYYLYRTRNYLGASLLLIIVPSVAQICCEPFYDWNTASFPLLVAGAIAMLEYFQTQRRRCIIVLGVIICLMAMARVPHVAALPGAMVFILLTDNKRKIKDCCILFAVFTVTTLLLYTLILGAPTNWAECWSSKNIISGHANYRVLLQSLLKYKQLPEGTTPFLSLILAIGISRIKRQKIAMVVTAMAVAFIVVFNYFYTDMLSWYLIPDRPIMSYCLIVGIALFVMAFHANRDNRPETLKIAAVLAFTLIPGLGSDIMTRRFIWAFTLPIVLTFNPLPKQGIKVLILLILAASTSQLFVKKYRYTRYNTTITNNPRIDNILQTPEHKQWLDELLADIQANVPDMNDVTVAGQGKYLVNYLLTNGTGYQNAFFHYISLDQKEHVNPNMLTDIAKRNYVILVAPSLDKTTRLVKNQSVIESAGFEVILSKPSHIIYRRKTAEPQPPLN